MCPHGYHHNGFMETPALGTQEVRFIYTYIHIYIHIYIHVNLQEKYRQRTHSKF